MNKSVKNKSEINCLLGQYKKSDQVESKYDKKFTSEAGPFYIKQFLINKLSITPQRKIYEEYDTKNLNFKDFNDTGETKVTRHGKNPNGKFNQFSDDSKSDYSYVSTQTKSTDKNYKFKHLQNSRYEKISDNSSDDASSYTSSATQNSESVSSSHGSFTSKSSLSSIKSNASSRTSSKSSSLIPANSFALRYQKRRY
jgi:hypothetical protein